MRDQYKVLSERYEQVQENETYTDGTYELILKRILELSQPEDKVNFLKLLRKYKSSIFRPTRMGDGVDPVFAYFIRNTLSPGSHPARREHTIADRLYTVLYWAVHVLKRYKSKAGKEAEQVVKFSFDTAFNIWCEEIKEYKAIQAAQQQHTKTHGVDLSNL